MNQKTTGTTIHCPTEALYKAVCKKLKPTMGMVDWYREDFCINIDGRAWCELKWYESQGYTIISAQEYLGNSITLNYLIL